MKRRPFYRSLPGREGCRRQKKAGAGAKKALFFLLPSVAGVAVFVLFPFCVAVGRTKGLAVYREVLANRAFRLAAGNTARFMAAALAAIPDELYEAAEVDGAGEWRKLIHITLPQARRAANMILFLAVIHSFKVFREAYIVAGPYPHERIYLLQHLFNHWFLNLEIEKMSAAAVMLAACIIGVMGVSALVPAFLKGGGCHEKREKKKREV